MLRRGLSGVVFLVLMVGGILSCKYAYGLLFLVLMLCSLREFYVLAEGLSGVRIPRWSGMLGAASLFGYGWVRCYGVGGVVAEGALLLLLFGSLVAVPMRGVLRYRVEAFAQWAWQLLGLLYVAVPFALATGLAAADARWGVEGGLARHGALLLAVLALVWVNDTGAYLWGSALGRHRLIERVSPKKSWEGFAGGLAMAALAGWAMGQYLFADSPALWLGLGLVVGLAAVGGDLIESLLKRRVGVKDSGRFLPGHGGFLDRFDAMLLAVPVALVYLNVCALFGCGAA